MSDKLVWPGEAVEAENARAELSAMRSPWKPYDPCVCGCGVVGWKTVKPLKTDPRPHVVGCTCRPHLGKRNQKKGKLGEYNRHRRLGGEGFTPHDELPHTYPLTVTTQDKKGRQVPREFVNFVRSTWYRHAMEQAIKKLAIGSDAHAALYLEPEGGGAWLLVDISPKTQRKLEPRS